MFHDEEWQPRKRRKASDEELGTLQPEPDQTKPGWVAKPTFEAKEHGERPDTGVEVGIVKRDKRSSDLHTHVTIFPARRLVRKVQEVRKHVGEQMFALYTEFIDEDKLNPDPTRETFFFVRMSQVKNPCQGKKIRGGAKVILALETWTEAVPGAEPTPGCITLDAAEALARAFMANSRWIHRSMPVHGDQHAGNYHWEIKPDGTLSLKAFDFGYAFIATTRGNLSQFSVETSSYVSALLIVKNQSDVKILIDFSLC